MSKTHTGRNRKKDEDSTEDTTDINQETETSQDKLLEVMQQLLLNQNALLEDHKQTQSKMWTRAHEQEQEEKERWRQQQEWRREERELEQQRTQQEWELRMEELRLRTEELKKSEEKRIEAQILMEKKEEKRRLQKRAEKIEPWRDSDQPEAYFVKFERVMAEAEIPRAEWASRLVPLLTGKVLAAYHSQVSPTATKCYDDLKEALLDALGLAVEQVLVFSSEVFRLPTRGDETNRDDIPQTDSPQKT